MSKFLPENYLGPKARISMFKREHGINGSIVTDITSQIMNGDTLCITIKATILVDGKVLATGHAFTSTPEESKAVEKAETIAIGRALIHAGYPELDDGEAEKEVEKPMIIRGSTQNTNKITFKKPIPKVEVEELEDVVTDESEDNEELEQPVVKKNLTGGLGSIKSKLSGLVSTPSRQSGTYVGKPDLSKLKGLTAKPKVEQEIEVEDYEDDEPPIIYRNSPTVEYPYPLGHPKYPEWRDEMLADPNITEEVKLNYIKKEQLYEAKKQGVVINAPVEVHKVPVEKKVVYKSQAEELAAWDEYALKKRAAERAEKERVERELVAKGGDTKVTDGSVVTKTMQERVEFYKQKIAESKNSNKV